MEGKVGAFPQDSKLHGSGDEGPNRRFVVCKHLPQTASSPSSLDTTCFLKTLTCCEHRGGSCKSLSQQREGGCCSADLPSAARRLQQEVKINDRHGHSNKSRERRITSESAAAAGRRNLRRRRDAEENRNANVLMELHEAVQARLMEQGEQQNTHVRVQLWSRTLWRRV